MQFHIRLLIATPIIMAAIGIRPTYALAVDKNKLHILGRVPQKHAQKH